jgi:hypothetical protein
MEKRQISSPCRESNPGRLVCNPSLKREQSTEYMYNLLVFQLDTLFVLCVANTAMVKVLRGWATSLSAQHTALPIVCRGKTYSGRAPIEYRDEHRLFRDISWFRPVCTVKHGIVPRLDHGRFF